MIDRKILRAQLGPVEDILVIGPRFSGQTTIAKLLADWHRSQGRRVQVTGHSRVQWKGYQDSNPQVRIWDGIAPPGGTCRVISTSEIF